jgi:hypothetical protein
VIPRCRTCDHWDARSPNERESEYLVNDCKIKMRSFTVGVACAEFDVRGDGRLESVCTDAMFGCTLHTALKGDNRGE